MSRAILLKPKGDGLEAVPALPTTTTASTTSTNPNDDDTDAGGSPLLSHFPKSKRGKIKKLLTYLRENPQFVFNLHTAELALSDYPDLTIDLLDFLNWITFTRRDRPLLKQPPNIEQFLGNFSKKAIKKLIVKDKRGGRGSEVVKPKKIVNDWLI